MLDSELLLYKSKVVTNDGTNGGRMSSTDIIISGLLQNLWEHVTKSQRLNGYTSYKKVFAKVANDADETLLNPGYYVEDCLGDDWVVLAPGTQRNTQADWTGGSPPSRWYGCGVLVNALTAGVDDTLTVDMKDASITGTIGLANEAVVITNKTEPDAVTGTTDLATVDGNSPSISGTEVTFTLTAAVQNDYAAGDLVAAIYEPSDVAASVDNVTDTSGIFDETQLVLDHIGTTEQTVQIDFTTGTAFTIAIDDGWSSLPSGDIGTEYVITNEDLSKPCLTIPTACWDGTPVATDQVIFQIHPAAVPLIQKRVVPSNCASLANNRIRQVILGESVT